MQNWASRSYLGAAVQGSVGRVGSSSLDVRAAPYAGKLGLGKSSGKGGFTKAEKDRRDNLRKQGEHFSHLNDRERQTKSRLQMVATTDGAAFQHSRDNLKKADDALGSIVARTAAQRTERDAAKTKATGIEDELRMNPTLRMTDPTRHATLQTDLTAARTDLTAKESALTAAEALHAGDRATAEANVRAAKASHAVAETEETRRKADAAKVHAAYNPGDARKETFATRIETGRGRKGVDEVKREKPTFWSAFNPIDLYKTKTVRSGEAQAIRKGKSESERVIDAIKALEKTNAASTPPASPSSPPTSTH
jgi:hypothetical protein